ncbi:hypothetical protein BDY21DRAFT_345005 [Lineolata rhizophorae]|uniref:Uncharacterized protein n=1 Tax=Lineolata rhizophorae TaxID=578093 RepID=A0A6A6NZJ5_9PEZI|nr:hypothetical protein BDY21DRAFT_345005 [Lineolata rhizophorae]
MGLVILRHLGLVWDLADLFNMELTGGVLFPLFGSVYLSHGSSFRVVCVFASCF